jgi:hypothetical protein
MSTPSTASSTDGPADARPTRRTVTRAVAWTVPVVAASAAAPAYAASPCDQRLGQVLDWDGANVTFTRTATTARAIFDPDRTGPVPALTLDVTTKYEGNMVAGSENGDTSMAMARAAAVGGLGVSGLGLTQATTSVEPNTPSRAARGYGDRGAYTFTFSRPVSNLVFTITDIDSQSGDFRDALVISPGYTVESQAAGIELVSSNSTPNRWFQGADNNAPQDDATGGGGNLRVRFAGPLATFTITYWNRQSSYDSAIDTNQRIFVSDLTFDYTPC